jgi:hypothetical protein
MTDAGQRDQPGLGKERAGPLESSAPHTRSTGQLMAGRRSAYCSASSRTNTPRITPWAAR